MIGVVTPYKVNNYGTKLQAYAMQKLFNDHGKAEIIDFLTKTDKRLSAVTGKLFSIDIWNRKIRNKLSDKKLKKDPDLYQKIQLRNKAINSFDKEYLVMSEHVEGNAELNKLISKYSTIVCGSDQLWAPRNVIADYFTLTWVPDKIKRISFSASFGLSSVPTHLRKKYRKYLSGFDAIAVRENKGREIVKELIGKDAVVTLDPTLMLDRQIWIDLAEKGNKKIEGKYIFCYFLGASVEHRKWARKLADRTGCKIVIMPHFIDYCAADTEIADVEIYDATPVDFLRLIKDAEYIATDSFHASVFSVMFEKKAAIFERFNNSENASTNSRIYSLVNNLSLENLLVDSSMDIKDFLNIDIDYNKVHDKLKALKKISLQYIEDAIGQKG